MLAAWPGQVVELQTIVEALWGSGAPRTVENTLQVHVSHLRRMLGHRSSVQRTERGYLLDLPRDHVDAERFVDAMHLAGDCCRSDDFQAAEDILVAALALWRGTPFLGLHGPQLRARRARLEEMRSVAREDLVLCRINLAADQFQQNLAVADAAELVALDPQRERGHALLHQALQAAGRHSDASMALQQAQQVLAPGMAPGNSGT